MTRLAAEQLSKSYRRRQVVNDVSLFLDQGEIVGLLGPNGAGKTTTFYMMVGLIRPNAGRIMLDGRDIGQLPMHQRARLGMGYLPQEASVFRRMSVADNILAVLETLPLDASDRQGRLERLLDELHIQHIRDTMGHSLSGGERRRVEIARTLATEPKFILLDEPFAGVDPISVLEIQRLIQGLKARNIGVLITDHNVRETLGICERAYILNQGAVLTTGTPEEIVYNDMVKKVYLGESFRI